MIDRPIPTASTSLSDITVDDTEQTTCCIVGGGPAGAVLALMLARQGVPVTLLEAHTDFDREFRGDTLHPSAMEIMAELGLAGRLLELRHTKLRSITVQTAAGPTTLPLRELKTAFPFITMMPQVNFLEFVTAEARQYPHFRLEMGARVEELIQEHGQVCGVRYRANDGWHNVRALLTVGTDGRFSRIRRLAGFEPVKTSPMIDVLWFKLPRQPTDAEDAFVRIGDGHMLVALNRFDYWQIAYLLPKDGYQTVHAAGLPALQQSVAKLAPELWDRVAALDDWKHVAPLSVESSRCPRWYRPGLLVIGDAAHTMSPVGGLGINYAIQDAVAAANILAKPLRNGHVTLSNLRAVQRRRAWPTRVIQAWQALLQRQLFTRVLVQRGPLRLPLPARLVVGLPWVRQGLMRLMAFGIWPVHVRQAS